MSFLVDQGEPGVSFLVEVDHEFRAVQGLPSPVRARRGLSAVPAGEGVEVVVRAGVAFADEQLTDRGWFFDTDAAAEELGLCCADLQGRPWTEVFAFRPTFELVARHLYQRLASRLPQLAFIEIEDRTFGVKDPLHGSELTAADLPRRPGPRSRPERGRLRPRVSRRGGGRPGPRG